MQERQGKSLGQEDTLEKEMATHSNISCLGNPMGRGAWQATVLGGHKESDTTDHAYTAPFYTLSTTFKTFEVLVLIFLAYLNN